MKKNYLTPEIEVVKIANTQLLSSSETDIEIYDVPENEEQI